MSVITDILSSPLTGILQGVGDIIGKFVKDPNEQAQAQLQLATLHSNVTLALMQADEKFADAQAAVITAEEKEGWLAANWRPLVMLMFTFIIANNYILDPWFHVGALQLPPDMWGLLKLGMSGYIIGRSVEKFLPDTVESFGTAVANYKGAGAPAAAPVAPTPIVITPDYFSRVSDASSKKVIPQE